MGKGPCHKEEDELDLTVESAGNIETGTMGLNEFSVRLRLN